MFGWEDADMARIYTRKAAQKNWPGAALRRSVTAGLLSHLLSLRFKTSMKAVI
jgi:hypothetical protein